MASIQNEINQIQKALHGEDVRQSICDGLQKINDDNNKYNDIKETVEKSAKDVLDNVFTFHTDFEKSEQLIKDLETAYSTADQHKREIDEKNSKAESNLSELDQKNKTAETNANSLDTRNNTATANINSLDTENLRAEELLELFNLAQEKIKDLETRTEQIQALCDKAQAENERLSELIAQTTAVDIEELNRRMTAIENDSWGFQKRLNNSI